MSEENAKKKKEKVSWKPWQLGVLAVMVIAIALFQIMGITNRMSNMETEVSSDPVSTVELTSDGVTTACTAGIIFDGHTVKYPGTITAVYFEGDGTSSSPYVITVDGQIDPITTYDGLFEDNMLQAEALAGALKDDERVKEIIWRGSARATSTGQHFTVVVDTDVLTSKAPDTYTEPEKFIDNVETYNIAGVVYARLDNYASIAQKKE